MAVTIVVVPATNASQPNQVQVSGPEIASAVVRLRRVVGGSIEDIGGAFLVDATGTFTYLDYLYPFDAETIYQVYDSTGTTLLAESAPVPAVPSEGTPWIRDLIFPSLRYAAVTIVDVTNRMRAGRVTPYWVTAQTYAVTAGDVRSGSIGQLIILCHSHEERDRVLYSMSTGNPCVLRVPTPCRVVVDEMYFTPQDITENRYGIGGACILTVDFVEVDASDLATFRPVIYSTQTANAAGAALLYGSLLPSPTGLSAAFYGYSYSDMFISPTGIAP